MGCGICEVDGLVCVFLGIDDVGGWGALGGDAGGGSVFCGCKGCGNSEGKGGGCVGEVWDCGCGSAGQGAGKSCEGDGGAEGGCYCWRGMGHGGGGDGGGEGGGSMRSEERGAG